MRAAAVVVAVGVALVASAARARVAHAGEGARDPVQPDGGVVLLARGATWQAEAVPAPRPTRQVAAVVLAGLDVAAGRRAAGVAVHGDDARGVAPPAWPLALPGAARARAPIAPDPGATERIALVRAITRFTLDPARGELRVLDVHARYGDGLVVWLNGVEIARRRLPRGARPMAMAGLPRGPEWETFHVPVVPGLLRAGDNVVAVEVRPSGRSTAPRVDLEIVGRPSAALVRGPILQEVTRTSATIVVETDLPTVAAVEWGTDPSLGRRAGAVGAPARRHAIALPDLPPGATIHYRVLAAGAATPIRSFRLLPGPGEVVRIAVYGDVRGGHAVHAGLVAQLRAQDPDLVITTGDLVLRGSDEGDWQRFFAIAGELLATVPFWSAPGNHDLGRAGDARRRFGDVFVLPPPAPATPDRPAWASWHAIDVGDVHIVFLDSNTYDEPRQLAWLDLDLAQARARGARVLLAVTHDGPYSRGIHGGNRTAVDHYVPILVRHGVAMLFSGHDHLYQRGRQHGLAYVVSGGGGAPLYAVSCGVPGKPACKVDDGMVTVSREHHYVMVTAYPEHLEVCPRRPDGSPLEPCTRYPLP